MSFSPKTWLIIDVLFIVFQLTVLHNSGGLPAVVGGLMCVSTGVAMTFTVLRIQRGDK